MADEPNGTGDSGGQPPPPPLAPDADPPPLAAAPPPLAAAPPPLAPPPAPAGKSLSAGLVAGGVVVLVLTIGAILYFTGVFDRRPAADGTKTETAATAPVAATGAGSSGTSIGNLQADADTPPCRTVLSEAEADRTPLTGNQSRNRVVVNASGEISWNGDMVDHSRFRQYLDITNSLNPPPLISVRFDPGAPQAQTELVREAIYRSLHCRYPPA